MSVSIEYLNSEKTIFKVDYGAKRRVKYDYRKLNFSDEQLELLEFIPFFTASEVNIKALVRLTDSAVFSLVEKITRIICGIYKPKKVYGIEKSVIRAYVYATITKLLSELNKEGEMYER